jgi:CarD family transcriptional regulator
MKRVIKAKKVKAKVKPKVKAKVKAKVATKPKAKTPLKKEAPKKVLASVRTMIPHKVSPVMNKKVMPEVKEIKKIQAPIHIPFNIGDYAVYPAHGVGRIEAVETKSIMDEKMEFLVINILDTGMNVLVPVKNINNVGLRQVIKGAKVKDVYDVLKEKKRSVMGPTWNRRYREYMEKIKSGSVFEIAEVLRDLIVLKKEKELSFGERKMLDTAKTLLIKELALAKGINEKKIEAEMLKIFSEL